MRTPALAEALVGLGVAALGLFIGVETNKIQVAPIYAKVGPQVIPYIVAAGLIALGVLLAVGALRRPAPPPQLFPVERERGEPADWLALFVVSAGLVLHMLLLEAAGFVVASAILFFCVAVGMGSRRYLRDALVALVLARLVYMEFTHSLDLQLPAGSWWAAAM
jgi:putative tricarboxylic transport membrane protein